MKMIKIIETADELLQCKLPEGAGLVFDNDMSHVFLQGSGEFELSSEVTVEQVVTALAATANLNCHIT